MINEEYNYSNIVIKQSIIPTDVYLDFYVTGYVNGSNCKFSLYTSIVKLFTIQLFTDVATSLLSYYTLTLEYNYATILLHPYP